MHVPPTPGVFTINIGDMMMRWTNAQCNARSTLPCTRRASYCVWCTTDSSTIHRVINISNVDRYSIPFFFNPNLETEIKCLPGCEDADGSAKNAPPGVCKDILEDFYRKAGLVV